MRPLAIGAQVTLGAPRHYAFKRLLNRLNQSRFDCPIPAITSCGLLDKARCLVINASECSLTPFGGEPNAIAPLDFMLQASTPVASAHKSVLQSFNRFLCLKTRVRHES